MTSGDKLKVRELERLVVERLRRPATPIAGNSRLPVVGIQLDSRPSGGLEVDVDCHAAVSIFLHLVGIIERQREISYLLVVRS